MGEPVFDTISPFVFVSQVTESFAHAVDSTIAVVCLHVLGRTESRKGD